MTRRRKIQIQALAVSVISGVALLNPSPAFARAPQVHNYCGTAFWSCPSEGTMDAACNEAWPGEGYVPNSCGQEVCDEQIVKSGWQCD
jgi:hypothetical protein